MMTETAAFLSTAMFGAMQPDPADDLMSTSGNLVPASASGPLLIDMGRFAFKSSQDLKGREMRITLVSPLCKQAA
jgi:hypothetical protein